MKKTLSIMLMILLSSSCYANCPQLANTAIGNGIGIGSALAVAICWSRTHSVLVSALAGLFGWLYVIYYLIVREKEE